MCLPRVVSFGVARSQMVLCSRDSLVMWGNGAVPEGCAQQPAPGDVCEARGLGGASEVSTCLLGVPSHSFQGSFFSGNHQKPRGNSRFLKKNHG